MINVFTLGGKACLDYGIPCLLSFSRCCKDPHHIQWLDDGSLSDADCDTITSTIPNATVIRPDAANKAVHAYFAEKPWCVKFRDHHVGNRQVMDTMALTDSPYIYVDTDILFTRNFKGLAAHLTSRPAPFFIHSTDTQHAYNVRLRSFVGPGRFKLIAKVNTGLFALSPHDEVREFLETVLSNKRHHRIFFDTTKLGRWWAIQTLGGLLGHRFSSARLPFELFTIPIGNHTVTQPPVATHYVGPVRGRLQEKLNAPDPISDSDVVDVPLEPPIHYPVLSQSAWITMRRIKRTLKR